MKKPINLFIAGFILNLFIGGMIPGISSISLDIQAAIMTVVLSIIILLPIFIYHALKKSKLTDLKKTGIFVFSLSFLLSSIASSGFAFYLWVNGVPLSMSSNANDVASITMQEAQNHWHVVGLTFSAVC